MAETVRFATLGDIPAADRIHMQLYPEGRTYAYAQNIRHSTCINLVADQQNQVVGLASVLLTRWNPNGKHLWERAAPYFAFLGVLPELQGTGIGGRLVDEAVRQTVARCPSEPFMYLEHEPENHRAHSLYERKGFKALSAEEILDATGLPNRQWPVMRLALNHSEDALR